VAARGGTEGKLGGQRWWRALPHLEDLTDSVNSMASPSPPVRNIAESPRRWRGDLSKKITVNVSGRDLQLKETLNT